MSKQKPPYSLHKVYNVMDSPHANTLRVDCNDGGSFFICYGDNGVDVGSLIIAKWDEDTGDLENLYAVRSVDKKNVYRGSRIKGYGEMPEKVPFTQIEDLSKKVRKE
ncbi:MAG TPA: hypothetical protein VJH34_01280 [archaeon]|nr:hypothetical protein [archaeon]